MASGVCWMLELAFYEQATRGDGVELLAGALEMLAFTRCCFRQRSRSGLVDESCELSVIFVQRTQPCAAFG